MLNASSTKLSRGTEHGMAMEPNIVLKQVNLSMDYYDMETHQFLTVSSQLLGL